MTAASRKRVLIVDDSVEYLNFMRLLLAAEGFEAEVAETTARFTERLRAAPPDLIISDVRLPGQRAFAILDLLEKEECCRHLPVLLCTGAVQEVRDQAERLRRDGREVLLKPFDIDDLLRAVGRLCANGSG